MLGQHPLPYRELEASFNRFPHHLRAGSVASARGIYGRYGGTPICPHWRHDARDLVRTADHLGRKDLRVRTAPSARIPGREAQNWT